MIICTNWVSEQLLNVNWELNKLQVTVQFFHHHGSMSHWQWPMTHRPISISGTDRRGDRFMSLSVSYCKCTSLITDADELITQSDSRKPTECHGQGLQHCRRRCCMKHKTGYTTGFCDTPRRRYFAIYNQLVLPDIYNTVCCFRQNVTIGL